MSPQSLLTTALLLGAYVLCGGAFGTCYAAGRVQGWGACARLAPAFFALQVGVMLALLILTPLGAGWKVLIAISTAVYVVVPSLTLRYLQGLHAP